MTEQRICSWITLEGPPCDKPATHYMQINGEVKTDQIYCEDHAKEAVENSDGSLQAVPIKEWDEYLELNEWHVYRLSVAKAEIMIDMARTLTPMVYATALETNIELEKEELIRFYFNFYFDQFVWYIKLGLCNFGSTKTDEILERVRKEFGARVTEEDPDLRVIDGEVMEDIKVLSCNTFFQMFDQKALSPKQAEFFFHFLCNMMGFNYDMELNVALSLAYGVRFRRSG